MTTNTEIGAFINAQTEDTSPDSSADFLLEYDTSAGTIKKVKPSSLVIPATLEIKAADGTLDVASITKIVVPNTSLTDDGSGQVTLQYVGGEGVWYDPVKHILSIGNRSAIYDWLDEQIAITSENASARLSLHAFSDDAQQYPEIDTMRSRGTIATPTNVQAEDILFGMGSSGYDTSIGDPSSVAAAARMRFVADEDFSSTAHGTRFEIWTTPNGSLEKRVVFTVGADGSINIPAGSTYNVNGSQHPHSATDITSDTFDGDRLPELSETKKGGVPATGTPSGKFLKDDGTWAAVSGGGDSPPVDAPEHVCLYVEVFKKGEAVVVGDGVQHFFIPTFADRYSILEVAAWTEAPSSSGDIEVSLYNQSWMQYPLSENIKVLAGNFSSYTNWDHPPVINPSFAMVGGGGAGKFAVNIVGAGTDVTGLMLLVTLVYTGA